MVVPIEQSSRTGSTILYYTSPWQYLLNSPPQAVHDIGYEGMPSDVYMCWAGKGTAMLRGDIPYNATKPDCVGMTQPTIPLALPTVAVNTTTNATAATVVGSVTYALRWTPALALEGGGSISHYEVSVEGTVLRRTQDARTTAVLFTARVGSVEAHGQWRVRAVNTLGNVGGWSLQQQMDS
jgi:hypothetical protein